MGRPGRRHGLQAEVLASLAIVMLTATGVLGALLARTQDRNVQGLRELAAQALLAAADSPLLETGGGLSGLRWWTLDAEGRAQPRGGHGERFDDESRALAMEARQSARPMLRTGPPWEPVRFAAPLESGVAVARLPSATPGWLLLGVLLGDVAVFTAFGATLLRGRLVRPLQRLAAASRAIAAGDLGARVPADGPRETFELATAFNEMTGALESRTRALEKAVSDLRDSNRDVRTARAGLDRAERLAAVGRLAAGVAHEVGNPMGALLAFLDLAARDPALAEASRGHLERAVREGERVRVILRQLLDFSRPPRTERAPVDLVGVAREVAGLVAAQRRYADIALDVAADGAPPLALADRQGVSQILLNLVLNAADALRAADVTSPRVEVRVRPAAAWVREDEPPETARQRERFDAVECVVADNGPGIPEDDRERIFDPFFTTKEPGDGTGLGLSNALRFAEELGGTLELQSPNDSDGAAFLLRLPAANTEADASARTG